MIKRVMLALLLFVSVTVASATDLNSNAETTYRAGQAVCYDGSWGESGDWAHVQAADKTIEGAGVTFLELCQYRDFFGIAATKGSTMEDVWFWLHAF